MEIRAHLELGVVRSRSDGNQGGVAARKLGGGSYALVLEGKRHLYHLCTCNGYLIGSESSESIIWDSRSALYVCRMV